MVYRNGASTLDSTPCQHGNTWRSDIEAARRLHKQHGTSYYFATRFFPQAQREATFALYAFFRVPDELVDNPAPGTDARRSLENWRNAWRRAYRTGHADHPVLRVTAHVFHHYKIPYDYSEAFLAAMLRDLDDSTYATYADLESYMYGSAAVVGLMMTHIIGFSDPAALPLAEKLGYAMQLTNFLRDIDEDWQLRGRIYLPLDEMHNFGVSSNQILEQRYDANFASLMRFQIERAHRLYDEAAEGIPLLAPEGRRAVRVASTLYRGILDKLAAQNGNPFAGRARTNTLEKLILAARAWNG
ncbi:MAG: phytoene/squalene synthase family protein [Armatimonas sp.]